MQTILSGHGVLLRGEADIGRVEYKIVRTVTARSRSAQGTIWGDQAALFEAFTAGALVLRRDDGGQDFHLKVTSCEGSQAQISLDRDPVS